MRISAVAITLAAISWGGAATPQTDIDIDTGVVMGVEIGMPLYEARERVRGVDWDYEPRFMVDISADCASYRGETLFCALVLAGPYEEEAPIEGLVVLSDRLQARDGVRVGMSLDDAARLWGAPTLSFHYANEAREFITFANGPERISARGGYADPGEETFGAHFGIYPPETIDQEYQSTNAYLPGSTIGSLWLF